MKGSGNKGSCLGVDWNSGLIEVSFRVDDAKEDCDAVGEFPELETDGPNSVGEP